MRIFFLSLYFTYRNMREAGAFAATCFQARASVGGVGSMRAPFFNDFSSSTLIGDFARQLSRNG
jgi:hypothetical protein